MRVLGMLLFSLVALLAPKSLLASPGDPDGSFGGGTGKVSYGYLSQDDYLYAVAQQKDGKIVGAGYTSGQTSSLAVVRLDASGALDSSFGGGTGKAIHSVMSRASALGIQDDGKIVLAGSFGGDMRVVRLTDTGTIDQGFGDGGVSDADFGGYDGAVDLAILPDGRILVAGTQFNSANVLLARFLPNGDPDPDFGSDGKAIKAVNADEAYLRAMTILPNRKIALVGSADLGSGSHSVLTVVFGPNGTPDPGFGDDGVQIQQLGGVDDYGIDVLPSPPDRILVVANAKNASNQSQFALMLQGPTGSLIDFEITDINVDCRPKAAAARADGKIVVAGSWGSLLGVLQYTSSLQLDSSFGQGGIAKVDIGTGFDGAEAVLVQGDGKIVAAGSAAKNVLSAPDFAFARLAGTPQPLLADDFANGVVSWNLVSGNWLELNGYMYTNTATTATAYAPLPWSPSNASSCSTCTMLASLGFGADSSTTKLTLTAWRQSATKQVQLVYAVRTGKWTLKQQANGATIRRRVKYPIAENVAHDVGLSFDGTDFRLSVDGHPLIRMPSIFVASGNVGFRIHAGSIAVRNVLIY